MGEHMMNWPRFTFFNFWAISIWIVFIVIAFLVYKDAKDRGENGLLWFILVALPWIGILFLIIYLILRGDEEKPEDVEKKIDDILNERYAKGEITWEEYQQIKKNLKKNMK